jgi:solute carrier family 10 (sodium/bile acid cotransporter), member 7
MMLIIYYTSVDDSKKNLFVVRYWLVFAIGATVGLAFVIPGPARELPKLHIIDIGVVVIMFLGSLKLAPARFKEAAGRPDVVVLSLISVFVMAPLFSLGIASLAGLDSNQDHLAMLICSAQASTLATAIVLTEVAGGDVATAMVITVLNNIASAVLTPLVFFLLGGASIEVDYMEMAQEMALKIVLPCVLAQVARIKLANFATTHSRKLSVTSQLIILIYIYTGVASGLEYLSGGIILLQVFIVAATLHAALLVTNALVARLIWRDAGLRTAFVMCSSQKTLPAAILIWKSHFLNLPLGPLIMVVYHLIQLMVDSVLAPGFMKLPLIRSRSHTGNKEKQ